VSAFWDDVATCKHTWQSERCDWGNCSMWDMGCHGWTETYCMNCHAYITKDPCGENVGISGWSRKRWDAHYSKRRGERRGAAA